MMWLTLRNKNLFSSSHFYKINLPLGSSYPKTPGDQRIGDQNWAKSDWAYVGSSGTGKSPCLELGKQ